MSPRSLRPVTVAVALFILALLAPQYPALEQEAVDAIIDYAEHNIPLNEETGPLVHARPKRGVSCYAGRFGCIMSCKWQDCSTGYCQGGTCVCSRCS